MPIIKSAKKALRQSRRRAEQNKVVRRALATSVKSLRRASEAAKARDLLPGAYQKIDKAAKKGLIHPNTAARQKSRLAKRVDKIL